MEFINCIIFLVISGVIIFLIGRIFPRKWINFNKFPFTTLRVEQNGKIYEKIGIKKWKDRLPDASKIITKIIPNFMPVKNLNERTKEKVGVLIKETCIAEITHFSSIVVGFYCVKLWKYWGSLIAWVWLCLNMPFILVQRYNRPRLVKTYTQMA